MSAITELVQRMKLAASLATQGEWSYARSGFNSIVQAPVALLRGGAARVVLCKLFRSEWRSELNTAHDAAFIALANPANVMTLVEALEATEKTSAARKEAIERTHKMFQRERDRADAAEKRITEPESSTVKPPNVLALVAELEARPATDAFLAEVRAQARNEGINYAASRLAAAFNHGFVDKPLTEVCDVVRMILDTKEELENSTLPAADGISGEYAEKFLEEFAAQFRKGVQS